MLPIKDKEVKYLHARTGKKGRKEGEGRTKTVEPKGGQCYQEYHNITCNKNKGSNSD